MPLPIRPRAGAGRKRIYLRPKHDPKREKADAAFAAAEILRYATPCRDDACQRAVLQRFGSAIVTLVNASSPLVNKLSRKDLRKCRYKI